MEGKTLAEKLAQAKGTSVSEDDVVEPQVEADVPTEASTAVAAPEAPTAQDASDTAAIVRAAKAQREGSAPQQVATKTCLIVDDSRVIRKVSSKIAKSLGYSPIEAENGEEALARCKKSMPQLVLTDWEMPEMDGLEFVTKLRAIPTPHAPTIVFCTSKGDVADIHEGINAGADDYIVKPFDEPSLRAKLEQLAAK